MVKERGVRREGELFLHLLYVHKPYFYLDHHDGDEMYLRLLLVYLVSRLV